MPHTGWVTDPAINALASEQVMRRKIAVSLRWPIPISNVGG